MESGEQREGATGPLLQESYRDLLSIHFKTLRLRTYNLSLRERFFAGSWKFGRQPMSSLRCHIQAGKKKDCTSVNTPTHQQPYIYPEPCTSECGIINGKHWFLKILALLSNVFLCILISPLKVVKAEYTLLTKS